jgi:hypothetical protein
MCDLLVVPSWQLAVDSYRRGGVRLAKSRKPGGESVGGVDQRPDRLEFVSIAWRVDQHPRRCHQAADGERMKLREACSHGIPCEILRKMEMKALIGTRMQMSELRRTEEGRFGTVRSWRTDEECSSGARDGDVAGGLDDAWELEESSSELVPQRPVRRLLVELLMREPARGGRAITDSPTDPGRTCRPRLRLSAAGACRRRIIHHSAR